VLLHLHSIETLGGREATPVIKVKEASCKYVEAKGRTCSKAGVCPASHTPKAVSVDVASSGGLGQMSLQPLYVQLPCVHRGALRGLDRMKLMLSFITSCNTGLMF